MSNEKKFKTIKDSIHGYIEIEDKYMKLFVDTPLFQRLGRIEQTSMRVLYPSARHDRFIHSIGTFYLGKTAFKYFRENVMNDTELSFITLEDWESWRKSFEIACLLHDIGHAPFSHTCEDFYQELQRGTIDNETKELDLIVAQLFSELKKCLNEQEYKEFYSNYGLDKAKAKGDVSPSPHEIVSSIVILKRYRDSIQELGADINLIIRAIIGCPFIDTIGEKGIKNCLIRMLNSPVIDVDKLDYIKRDSSLTGFSNAIIDTERLLKSFTAVKENDTDYYPAYNKNSLSAIQNVISANNLQQAWIVNHHVVVYNSYLIQTIINKISRIISPDNPLSFKHELFSVDAIIGEKDCCGKFKVNMLSDDDLWHLFKLHKEKIPEVEELLNRNLRKKAVWKSFAEYTLLFDEDIREYRNNDFDFEKFKDMYKACCDDAREFNFHLFDKKNVESTKKQVSQAGLEFCEIMSEFAEKHGLDINKFVILKGGSPSKNKAVISRNKLRIKFFDGEDGTKRYDKVMKLLPHEDIENKEAKKTPYFFFFYPEPIDKILLCEFIKRHKKLRFKELT